MAALPKPRVWAAWQLLTLANARVGRAVETVPLEAEPQVAGAARNGRQLELVVAGNQTAVARAVKVRPLSVPANTVPVVVSKA